MTKDKVVCDEIHMRAEGLTTPVLLQFQNGELKTAHKETTLYFPAKKEGETSKNHAVVVTKGSVYSGPILDSSNDLVDTYICVRNKETDKVRILALDQVKLINHVYEEKANTQFKLLSREVAFETAVRNFGSRKDVRVLNNRQRNKIDIDVFRDQLETTVEAADVTENSEQVATTEDILDRIRPTCNKDAKNLHQIFTVTDVIPLELLDRLDEEVSCLSVTNVEDIPISSEFLKQTFVALKKGPQSTQTLLKIKMIIYMDALLALIKSRSISLNKVTLSHITEKVETDIRKRFSDENSFNNRRTDITNEKAICYFLVLAFLINDKFELDLEMLTRELSLSKVKILKYANLVYAICKKSGKFLQLVLPSNHRPLAKAYVGKKRKSK